MSGHTPGEWRTGREDMQSYDANTGEPFTNVYVTDPRGGVHLGHSLPYTVARVFGDKDGESKANARLVAAAPELLTACEEAADDLSIVRDAIGAFSSDRLEHANNVIEESQERAKYVIGRLRAAIAKAVAS